MNLNEKLILEMIKYFNGDPKRIQHFIKVYSFAELIGHMESLSEYEMTVLEAAAITHDIGIKNSEIKYNSCSGKYQEIEGPAEAEKIMVSLGFTDDITERVKWLIAHHHTYNSVKEKDHRILVESDFLVNLFEDSDSRDSILSAYKNIFRTESGKKIFREMFALDIPSQNPENDNSVDGHSVKTSEIISDPAQEYNRMKILSGYAVSDKCVQCRTCIDVCPVQCIDGSRRPVYINQEKCLSCGSCASVCIHNAIIRI